MSSFELRRSAVEDAWDALSVGQGLGMTRIAGYDAASGLTAQPLKFFATDLIESPRPIDPGVEWVARTFPRFVKGEFSTPTRRSSVPAPFRFQPHTKFSLSEWAQDHLEASEQALVYGGMVDQIAHDLPRPASQTSLLHAILSSDMLGNKKNQSNLRSELMAEQFSQALVAQGGLRFVLPAFPYKDQNPFRTQVGPAELDVGEIALITRLHCLALAAYQVAPTGAHWILLTDGLAYADILGVDRDAVTRYSARLRRMRNHLNLDKLIHFIDLEQVASRLVDSGGAPAVSKSASFIESHIEDLVLNPVNSKVLETLVRGMRWNINTAQYASTVSRESMWTWLVGGHTSVHKVAGADRSVWDELDERVRLAAVKYAAYNLSLAYHNLLQVLFPESIRATMHPKMDQVAVPRLGTVFPWNGVGVLTRNQNPIRTISSMPLCGLRTASLSPMIDIDTNRVAGYFADDRRSGK